MNCAKVKSKLLQFWFNELSSVEHEVVQAHLNACKICSQEFRLIAGLLRRIGGSFRDEPVPPSVRKRLSANLRDRDSA